MIVPKYWAEARMHQARGKTRRQVTVRRFGWSDTSQADAVRLANERVREAFDRVAAGERLDRREPKIPYNGAQGVPIREEVLDRQGDVVITRNAYGAHCLNTPDVLFADVDFDGSIPGRLLVRFAAFLAVAGAASGLWLESTAVAALAAILGMILAYPVAKGWAAAAARIRGGAEQSARRKITAFVGRHPEWHVRLYRTPRGFRVLAMHRRFAPDSAEVAACFSALGVDPIYAAMCRNQQCFRARLTAKPWRIGIRDHMRPRPGTWPVDPAKLAVRQAWIARYEVVAAGFAACRFVEEIGSGVINQAVATVCDLHDRRSQALSGREIA